MFDVSFSEMLMIGIVALVVIGPERLPKVARTAGLLLGRMRRYVSDVKADINRELQLDELKQLRAEMQDSAREFEQSITSEIQSIEQTVQAVGKNDASVPSETVTAIEAKIAPSVDAATNPSDKV